VTGKEEMQLDHILSRGCKEYEWPQLSILVDRQVVVTPK
jgi:hypothetical protein